MQEINSRDNPKIKYAARLKEQKYRKQDGLFLIEGEKMLWEAINAGQTVISVFIDSEAYDKQWGADLPPDIEKYLVDSRIMKHICNTQTPQGIAAVVSIPHWNEEKLLDKGTLLLLLDRISDPGNLGTIIRTAVAFDVDGILLTTGCADPYNPKTVRSSMGAIFNVPVIKNINNDYIQGLKKKGFIIIGTSLDTKLHINKVNLNDRLVLAVGSEAHGLSSDIQDLCQQVFKIPISTKVDSLNAGVACGIILYEVDVQRKK